MATESNIRQKIAIDDNENDLNQSYSTYKPQAVCEQAGFHVRLETHKHESTFKKLFETFIKGF